MGAAAASVSWVRTITMLFTDIEGSTQLLHRLGDGYLDVLTAQRALLRGAFARHNGREMGTEGDSFFVVFDSVTDAIRCAAGAQAELAGHSWPAGVVVRVRMGLHTGEPQPHEDGYVGMDVHRTARIAACAHGGQVVASEATHRIASHQLLDGVSFLDLGQHRLRDVPGTEHLYQLVGDGLPDRFPSLRSLGAGSTLPVATTSLVGRDAALRDLRGVATSDGVRLLTLTGPGGSGKTRLAVALAAALDDQFADGVYLVPLETVTSTEAMWTGIADALGVLDESRAPSSLLEHLAPREALLLLDNLEQLPDAAGVVGDLLRGAPLVRVLATSRRPLHHPGEHEYAVPPLSLPESGARDVVERSGAVQLFVQRARMVKPGFALTPQNTEDVAEICRRLDGLPLAVELASARVKVLGVQAVRSRLDQSLDLATLHAGIPDRRRTLRAAIGWSYALLGGAQQRAFRQLGVFSGAFDLAALAAVVDDGVDPLVHVADLVDASLVEVADGQDGEPRVRLLRTIAAYARDQLVASEELDAAGLRHAGHYLSVVERESARLRGRDYLGARARIEVELDNVRSALMWSLTAADDSGAQAPERLSRGIRLCLALSWFWYACGHQGEGRRWMRLSVDAAGGRESPELMTLLHGLGVLALQHGAVEQGRDALATCLAFWRREGDLPMVARELNSLGVAHRALEDDATARALLAESIEVARRLGDAARLASALNNLAYVESEAGRHDQAIGMLREARELNADRGNAWAIGVNDVNLAGLMLRAGMVDEAFEQLSRTAPQAVALADPEITADALGTFCAIHAERGDATRAARLLGAAQALRQRAELPMAAPDAAALAASLDKVKGRPTAVQWQREVERGSAMDLDSAIEEALTAAPAASG